MKDLITIFNKYEIIFESSHQEVGDLYTFVFKTKVDVYWHPGQHGVFTITHTKIKKPIRAFSIASSPEEGEIRISTRIKENPSEFKSALLSLKKGQTLSMRGPIGGFYIHDKKPSLLIAGGIGITPYRSILKDLSLHKEKKADYVELLYMDSSKAYLYKDTFNDIDKDPKIKIDYLSERENFNKKIEAFITRYGNEGNYFVVGSKNMTKSIAKSLKENGIKRRNIRKDTFFGY
jgi:ferredoxin-NADP reductase